MEDLLTRKSLELKLSVSKSTIIRWEREGMPVLRIGGIVRYDEKAVKDWLYLRAYYTGKDQK